MTWTNPRPVVDPTQLDKVSERYDTTLLMKDNYFNIPTDKNTLFNLYKTMYKIRAFETKAWQLASEKRSLPIHPYTGHEAVTTGVCSRLTNRDYIVTNHRPYGHYLAKGGSIEKAMAELFGKVTGVNKGIGGELYLSEPEIGYVTSSMIVGACLTIATGVALGSKLTKNDRFGMQYTVCFFGDAAVTNGAFHEALEMAALYKLPIIFVCENNGYSTNTPALEYTTTPNVIQRIAGYGITGQVVDGTDVLSVSAATQVAKYHIADYGTPYFIEALVPRIGAHKQQLVEVRPEDKIFYAKMRDPISRYASALVENHVVASSGISMVHEEIEHILNYAVEQAEKARMPTIEELKALTFSTINCNATTIN